MENRIFVEFLDQMKVEIDRRPNLEKSIYGSGYADGLLKAAAILNEVIRTVRSQYDQEVVEPAN